MSLVAFLGVVSELLNRSAGDEELACCVFQQVVSESSP